MNQNLITLSSKEALELFDESLSNIINTENDYLSLDGLELTIGYNFDAFYMAGDICDSEEEAGAILESLSDLMKSLKPYYSKPFEIVIFAYHGAYSIDYWKFDGEKLFGGGDEIAFLYSKDEDDFPDDEYDEYEDAVSDYVDKITEEVRDSSTVSEDLIKAINDNGLYEIKYTKEESDKLTDDEALSSHKFSQENLESLKKDKNTKLEILKDIFTDIDFPDYANEEWYSALAHQKSVAKLEYYWEGILPDYPNVAKTLANNHHINKKLLSDVRNFGKKLEKVEETKNIGYAIEDLVFANPIFIELRFEIFAEGKDFFEEFYEPEKRRNSYFPLFLKNPNMPIDVLKKLVDEYDYYEAKEHPNYPKSNNLGVKIKNINEEHKISFELRMPTAEELDITDEQWEEQGWEWFSEPELLTSSIELGISNLDLSYDDFIDYIMNPKGNNWEKGDDVNTLKFPILGDWLIKVYNDSKSLLIDDMAGENVMLDYAILSIQIIENNDYDKAYKASKNIGENGSLSELYYEILDSIND